MSVPMAFHQNDENANQKNKKRKQNPNAENDGQTKDKKIHMNQTKDKEGVHGAMNVENVVFYVYFVAMCCIPTIP